MTPLPPADIRRIFVKTVNWVGDAVMVTPALRALRRAFPDAHITLMARPWVGDVYEANPDIDRLWLGDETRSLWWFRQYARRIREAHFDLGVSLPNSFGAAMLLKMGGIPRRLGYSRDARRLLLTHPVPVTTEILEVHQVRYYLNLVGAIADISGASEELVLPLAESAGQNAQDLLQGFGDPGAPLVGVCPGAAFGSAKRWYPERFAQVADALQKEHDARIAIVGSPKEAPICRAVEEAMQRPALNLCGASPLRGLIGLVDRMQLFLCNDSGAMHIAAARQTPLVAVFGPTDWKTTAPWSPAASLVRRENHCPKCPCLLRECPLDHACMDVVSVEDVLAEARRSLASGR